MIDAGFFPVDPNEDLCPCRSCRGEPVPVSAVRDVGLASVPALYVRAAADPDLAGLGLTAGSLAIVARALARAREIDPSIGGLVEWVMRDRQLTEGEIIGGSRKSDGWRARCAIAWAAKKLLGRSSGEIGRVINRDHSTVLYSQNVAARLRQQDPEFLDFTDRLVAAFYGEAA